jgi:Transport protein particle (TRAPP) component.
MSSTHTPTSGSPPKRGNLIGTPTNVSEPAFEYLLSSMLHWVDQECSRRQPLIPPSTAALDSDGTKTREEEEEEERRGEGRNVSNNKSKMDDHTNNQTKELQVADNEEEQRVRRLVMIAENAAAKMERIGYDVGYRLTERLAQNKSMIPPPSTGNNKKPTPAMIQLEVVKFICKDLWNEVFRKQIDKLQTNHRGVFVLKDLEFKWLQRLPSDVERARIMAIKILAFPCGLIRGAMANLDIASVVSCDFLADGEHMHCCSFNIKVKA